MVRGVKKSSAAAAASIMVGERIVAVDGNRVDTQEAALNACDSAGDIFEITLAPVAFVKPVRPIRIRRLLACAVLSHARCRTCCRACCVPALLLACLPAAATWSAVWLPCAPSPNRIGWLLQTTAEMRAKFQSKTLVGALGCSGTPSKAWQQNYLRIAERKHLERVRQTANQRGRPLPDKTAGGGGACAGPRTPTKAASGKSAGAASAVKKKTVRK